MHLTRRVPTGSPRRRKDWEGFVRNTLNLLWIRADPDAEPLYQEFLRAKYRDIAVLNENYGADYGTFTDIPLVQEPPNEGLALSDWEAFITGWEDPATDKEYTCRLT